MQQGFLRRHCAPGVGGTKAALAAQRDSRAQAATQGPLTQFRPDISNINNLVDAEKSFDIDDLEKRDAQEQSYVSRRRLEIVGFDVNAVDSVRHCACTLQLLDATSFLHRHALCLYKPSSFQRAVRWCTHCSAQPSSWHTLRAAFTIAICAAPRPRARVALSAPASLQILREHDALRPQEGLPLVYNEQRPPIAALAGS